jgi:hypothetical protein
MPQKQKYFIFLEMAKINFYYAKNMVSENVC